MKQIVAALSAAMVAGELVAASENEALAYNFGEGLTFGEKTIVTAEASFAMDSKYLSYGFVDNNDPIMTPGASLTFVDFFTLGAEAIFDMTKYGRKAGYGNRGGKYIEFHPYAGISHAFSPEDCEWLPTTVELGLDYLYEYHPSAKARHGDHDPARDDDTQFWTASIGLPDLWVEPTLSLERDVMRDNGTYVNFEIGHSFALVDGAGEGDDPLLALRPSIGQGFGNGTRVKAYACTPDGEPLNHAGLMDTCVKAELTWKVTPFLSLTGYAAYSDFIFDSNIREAARDYEATGHYDESYNFIGGVCATASF